MHAYFYGPDTKDQELHTAYATIKKVLRDADIWLSTNTEREGTHVSAEVLAAVKETGVPLLERMDTFVIEGSSADPQVGFLVAQAIAQRKPTLYLFRRGRVPEIFNHLNQKELPKYLKAIAYTEAGLSRTVHEFLTAVAGRPVKQVPRHKFTLRITDAIEEYLHYKTHNTKKTKADYLREEIEQLMANDTDWQDHLRRRRSSL